MIGCPQATDFFHIIVCFGKWRKIPRKSNSTHGIIVIPNQIDKVIHTLLVQMFRENGTHLIKTGLAIKVGVAWFFLLFVEMCKNC